MTGDQTPIEGSTSGAEELDRWKHLAMYAWAESAITRNDDELRESGAQRYAALLEVENMKATVSWRVTRPLRAVRGLIR